MIETTTYYILQGKYTPYGAWIDQKCYLNIEKAKSGLSSALFYPSIRTIDGGPKITSYTPKTFPVPTPFRLIERIETTIELDV